MELEQGMGKPLLVRGKRKITLTEDGALLRKRANVIMALLEKTGHILRADAAHISGEVAIGCNLALSLLRIAAAVRRNIWEFVFSFPTVIWSRCARDWNIEVYSGFH